MTIAERRREKVDEFVRPQLESGEQVVATISYGQTGPTPWLSGLIGVLLFFWVRVKAVVVTNQRVMVVAKSLWTNRPKGIDATYPRGSVRVIDYRPPNLWGKVTFALGTETLKLNVPRIHRDEAEAVVNALGGVAAPPPPPPA